MSDVCAGVANQCKYRLTIPGKDGTPLPELKPTKFATKPHPLQTYVRRGVIKLTSIKYLKEVVVPLPHSIHGIGACNDHRDQAYNGPEEK